MDNVKNAFMKVKEDINFLNNEILSIKVAIDNLNLNINNLNNIHIKLLKEISTIQHKIQANYNTPTHNPTVPQEVGGLKSQILDISTGNIGVPTDRQTDNQTDRQTENSQFSIYSPISHPSLITAKKLDKYKLNSIETNIKEASQILDSLDGIKKEIRLKFKHLTHQEMIVFSTIYQLEEQNKDIITYEDISNILNLSESSIRDYTQRLINKGIPIKKTKIDNKKISLSISSELKKIASLSTIIKLREI